MIADPKQFGGPHRHRGHQHQVVRPMTRQIQACEILDFTIVDLDDMVLWSSPYILAVKPSLNIGDH